jgi:hypothetical protein
MEIPGWRGAWTMPVLVFGMNSVASFAAMPLSTAPRGDFHARGRNGTMITWMQRANARFLSLRVNPANALLLYSLAPVPFC